MEETYIYDLETYPNFFLGVFRKVGEQNDYIFEISERKNDFDKLKEFCLEGNKTLVGFNNLGFDYPVLHRAILTRQFISVQGIFEIVQDVFETDWANIPDKEVLVKQIDLFKIWHYDNKNKATSLKWLEFALRMENIDDLPYPPGSYLTSDQMDRVISYCKNDIDATEAFYLRSEKHIELRQFYTDLEKMNLLNASEIKLSKEIFAKRLSEVSRFTPWEIKKLRTQRDIVYIKDLIFDYIQFKDPVNQKALEIFKSKKWFHSDKNSFGVKENNKVKFSIDYKNVKREYAEGGLHSFGVPGVYKSDKEHVLVDVDFASFYPHISFKNSLHPGHIPAKIFNRIYEGFYHERKKYPKTDPRNYVLKIILNGSYGLSKDKYSFLYDPKWQLAITINGQLLLTMLTELVYEKCKKNVQIIFENTDGAMYRIHRSDLDNLKRACQQMEGICNIPLETQECKKIIARDVNNYINIIDHNTIKFKGAFEINRDYHKNHSKRIVPLALANYFVNKISPEQTITNHFKTEYYNLPIDKKANTNFDEQDDSYRSYGIYDFCIGSKMKRDGRTGKQNLLYKRTYTKEGIKDEVLGKVNRYYVSNEGHSLIKKMPPLERSFISETEKHKQSVDSSQIDIFSVIEDVKVEPKDREENIEAGYNCTLFNRYKEGPYHINNDYYINEVYKIIKVIENGR